MRFPDNLHKDDDNLNYSVCCILYVVYVYIAVFPFCCQQQGDNTGNWIPTLSAFFSLLSQDIGEGAEARPVAGAHTRAAVGRMDSEDQENVGDHANVGASGGGDGEDPGPRPSRCASNIARSTRWPCNDQYACHDT